MKKLSQFREIEEAKKYTPPTKAEIEADKKKDRAGKPRPSMDSSSIKKNVYKEQTDEPASDDEAGMAMDQAKFIGYVANEIKEYISGNKEFPEWMQNKLTGLHEKAKDMHAVMAGKYNESVDEAAKSPYTGVKVTGPDDLEKEKKHYQAMRAKERKKELEDSVDENAQKHLAITEKLNVSDGMGAWIKDFQDSDAPQFKGKDKEERKEMAIAAYLAAKREAKNESTKAYGKSERDRMDKEKNARISPKDKVTLGKLAAMMAKEKGKK